MPQVNREWVKAQFSAARVRVGSGEAVLKLLEVWDSVKLSPDMTKDAVEIFSKIALNHSLIPDAPEEKWGPAQPGFILVGDEVRVLSDAFDGELGAVHNGRRGVVVGVRYGDVIMTSNDGVDPKLEGAHYSPHKLQKRYQ
jgi:hypothetical protein